MPHYYFHLFNDATVLDEEGQELRDDASAVQVGIVSTRAMAADSVCKGHLVLDHRIEIQRQGGETIRTIYFRDVVAVREHG